MELWDILDANGNKTGRTIERGQPFREGEYHLVVHVYLINAKGEFLIQKRSLSKRVLPGMWDMTGGAVLAGEDSATGAVREVEEELGIALSHKKLSMIARLKRKSNFIDIWATSIDVSLEDVVMQAGEVDAVKFVSADDMIKIIFSAEYREDNYKQIILNFLKNIQGQSI
ncbi:MAG TPA: NUDIX domain-containing protein [Methylomusa anaerophila]|uniref:Isopentenyl-diphosphate Delta-isomerase n=1 Tax=Methylomusa anaerophila TaxID=1930071 RepID=A0A348AEU2_9FIRM|nr:NUDIX domain-containing protein [Methylomusa anaerophila]BBB89590.1 isopentenyl-diphosphate Delta-isomerase [Methylomusa anaerophila]HML89637.1 NUDIX domain-containing protein [Methylomusa anaerophila]